MSEASDRLIALGGRLLIEHSSCLIALLDADGGLLAVNPALERLLAERPGAVSILTVLDPSSRLRFHELMQRAAAGERAGPATLHFVAAAADLSHSYRCYLEAVLDGQVALLAEPIAPLSTREAEEYMRLTSELSATTRSLQKTSHELAVKQRVLEEALATIEQIARVDELTQVLNRRTIMLTLAEEIQRARRYSLAVSILLIDIDHFKQINDRYGHPTGDMTLRECADLLRRSIRATDHFGRYGGEEFLCVLPMTTEAAAAELADRLRRDIARQLFTAVATVKFTVTISVGVAQLDASRETVELLVAHADNALYQAKAGGRDRVVVWSG